MDMKSSTLSVPFRILISISLMTIFIGCAQRSNSHSSDDPSPSASTVPFLSKGGISTDIESLHIQSLSGIGCSLFRASDLLSNPVLATSRLSYDATDIQQMAMFFENVVWNFSLSPNQAALADPSTITPPSTLRWVPGAGHYSDCEIDFQITNSGNSTVQIPYSGVILKKPPQRNDYQYRLIDVCTLLPPPKGGYDPSLDSYCGTQKGSNPGQCSGHYVSVTLGDVKEGSVFNQPTGSGPCPIIILSPGQSTVLTFDFSPSSTSSPDNFIYSFIPELTLRTSNGSHIIPLPQLEITVAFVKDSQVSCYGLQGASFALEKGGPFGNTGHSWCL